ncbi:hypothetical protein [Kiloniella majae]|uniref:hypothetical protein n=1 Tax=Kiloniella majae TaxID=1938558 RepID=UPI000A2787B8|nr:hypothetical protein [Kiloniella majae]
MSPENADNMSKFSKLVTAGLTVLFFVFTYLTLDMDVNRSAWVSRYLLQCLSLSTLLVLVFRLLPLFDNPGIKSTVLIVFWSCFVTLAVHFIYMDRPEVISLLANIQGYFGLQALLICALIYLLLLSVPFVPGVEIGLLIMAAFGKEGVLVVYLATLGGLSLSFFIGHFFPQFWTTEKLQKLTKLTNFKANSYSLTEMPRPLTFLFTLIPWITKYRYLTLALLINLPGNAIVGGGGGISFIGGASKKLTFTKFFLTLSLATLPIPLLIYFGLLELEKLSP